MLPEAPDTAVCRSALEIVIEYCSPALANHCQRAYVWAAHLGAASGASIDAELLYVAAMLHDLGLLAEFDNHMLPFEVGGGHIAALFAAGAGWPIARRHRLSGVIVAHMAAAVESETDPEGSLLQRATGFDIAGRTAEEFPEHLRAEALDRFPRLDLAAQFLACFEDQARRKPRSSAAAAVRSGIAGRLASNPLEGRPARDSRSAG